MISCKKILCTGLTCMALLANTCPVYAVAAGDVDFSADVTTNFAAANNPTVTIANGTANLVGKVRWSSYNVPQTQTVSYIFRGQNQTILNYIPVTPAMENASQIVGTIEGRRDTDTVTYPNAQCGRIVLINPNGISLVTADIETTGGKFSCNSGQTTFVASTLDFDAVDPVAYFDGLSNLVTSVDLTTYQDAVNGFANGFFTKTGSGFNQLKEMIILSNGIGITLGTQINLKPVNSDPTLTPYDNAFRSIVTGDATLSFTPNAGTRTRTPVTLTAVNTVPACTYNPTTQTFEGGGVRYFDFGPNIGQRLPNLGSQFQIALCTQTATVGDIVGFNPSTLANGIIQVHNNSNLNFGVTRYQSPVKITTKLEANGAVAATNGAEVFLTSLNPGQERNLMIVTDADQPTANIYINNVQGTTEDVITPWSNETVRIVNTGTSPNNRIYVTTSYVPTNVFDTKNSTDLPSAGGQCLGTCGTPPDPDEPVPPPVPPVPPTPPDGGDGGGSGAAIAIPLGVAGAGLLSLAALPGPIAAAPPVCQMMSTMRAIPTYAMRAPRYFAGNYAPAQTTGAAAPVAAPSTGYTQSGSPYTMTPIQPIQPAYPQTVAPGYVSPAAGMPEDEEIKENIQK